MTNGYDFSAVSLGRRVLTSMPGLLAAVLVISSAMLIPERAFTNLSVTSVIPFMLLVPVICWFVKRYRVGVSLWISQYMDSKFACWYAPLGNVTMLVSLPAIVAIGSYFILSWCVTPLPVNHLPFDYSPFHRVFNFLALLFKEFLLFYFARPLCPYFVYHVRCMKGATKSRPASNVGPE
jgi:hypothetical protein